MVPNAYGMTLICLIAAFGGGLLGVWLRTRLARSQELDPKSEEAVKLCVGVVATMTGLILGLIMASAKSNFDTVEHSIRQSAIRLITVDKALVDLGEPAQQARAVWREGVDHLVGDLSRSSTERSLMHLHDSNSTRLMRQTLALIGSLQASNLSEQESQRRAIQAIHETLESNWLGLYMSEASMPALFVSTILAWLAFTFFCYGLVSPPTRLVVAVFFVSSLSVAGAIFLILELELPFDGFMRVSWHPVLDAHAIIVKR